MGGFEAAAHLRRDRRRVDPIDAFGHDRLAEMDYGLVRNAGILTVRDGLRWHLIERRPGQYDWRSARSQMRAARDSNISVVWDLCHWGWPDDVDIMTPEFIQRFSRFSGEAVRVMREEGVDVAGWVPINEISYWALTGGQIGGWAPWLLGQGNRLKHQLVLAFAESAGAIRQAGSSAPVINAEPLIQVVPGSRRTLAAAARANDSMYHATDLLMRLDPSAVDLLGLNWYPQNQWAVHSGTLAPDDARRRPLHDLLSEVASRYGRPLLLTETGREEPGGAAWLRTIHSEVVETMRREVDLRGVCLYPVMDYPGWDNDRHCPCGLIEVDPVNLRRRLRPDLLEPLQTLQLLKERQSVH